MDLKLIKNLLSIISESEVNEMSIEEGDFKIKIKKSPDTIAGNPSPVYAPAPTYQLSSAPPPSGVSDNAPAESPKADTETQDSSNSIMLRSPIVGTFYRSSSPETDVYVEIGDKVSKGDTLCIVEAMKIMNEIESEYAGKITKIFAENGQPVEYDQPLFEIEPA